MDSILISLCFIIYIRVTLFVRQYMDGCPVQAEGKFPRNDGCVVSLKITIPQDSILREITEPLPV